MSELYNYQETVKEDLKEFIKDYLSNYELVDITSELEEKILDEAFVSDSVTGNGSGSYFFDTWKAEEALAHNLELVDEMIEYGYIEPLTEVSAERLDVCIRCYLLDQVFNEVFEEVFEEVFDL